jgi:hypothetical protein
MILLAIQAALSFASIFATLDQIGVLQRARDGSFVTMEEAQASDDRVRAIALVTLGFLLATGIVWLVWQHRGQRTLVRLGVRGLTFTPAWAVGWWFVPIANLWKPFQAVRELWRASRPDVDDSFWAGERTWAVIGWWWAVLLLSSFVGRVGIGVSQGATIDDYIAGDRIDMVSDLMSACAAALAIMVVRSITGRQEQKIEAGPAVPPRPDIQKGWRP